MCVCVVRCAGDIGIMFLSEVALGREKHITVDDSSLKKAPAGYDSIVARGRTEPGESQLYLSPLTMYCV